MKMKVIMEGDPEQIARMFAEWKVFAETMPEAEPAKPTPGPETPPAEAPQVDPIPIPSETPPKARSKTPPKTLGEVKSIRGRVLTEIMLHPNTTASEIASAIDVDVEQVRGAMKHYVSTGEVLRHKDRDGNLLVPHRFYPAGAAAEDFSHLQIAAQSQSARIASDIKELLRAEPGLTSRELARRLEVNYNAASSTTTKLMQKGELQTVGNGGSGDPFRYSLVD